MIVEVEPMWLLPCNRSATVSPNTSTTETSRRHRTPMARRTATASSTSAQTCVVAPRCIIGRTGGAHMTCASSERVQ